MAAFDFCGNRHVPLAARRSKNKETLCLSEGAAMSHFGPKPPCDQHRLMSDIEG